MNKEYILDACSLICFLNGDKQANKMEKILNQAFNSQLNLHISNLILGEVYFVGCRYRNEKIVSSFIDDLVNIYDLQIHTHSTADCINAAKLKNRGGIAYIDCFNLILSNKLSLPILTLDHEYKKFEKEFKVEFL